MPHVRIAFELDSPPAHDDPAEFKAYAKPFLDAALPGAEWEWGGYVAVDAKATKHGRLEPLWQFLAFVGPGGIDGLAEKAAEAAKGGIVPGYMAYASRGDWPEKNDPDAKAI